MSIWDAFGKGRYKGFSREAGQLLDKAVELAGGLGCKKADTGHLLWAMLQADGGPAARFLAGKNISELEVRRQLSAGRDGSVTRLARGDMAADLRRAMDYAIIGAQNAHLSRAEPEHLLCAMLEDTDCAAGVMLASMGVQLTEAVRECRQLSGQFILPIQPRSASSLPRGSRASDKYCRDLTRRAAEQLAGLPDVEVFASPDGTAQAGMISFRVTGRDAEAVGEALAERGIAVRAGLHCAPLAHRTAGTLDTGTVRVSFSAFNTPREVDMLVRALAGSLK